MFDLLSCGCAPQVADWFGLGAHVPLGHRLPWGAEFWGRVEDQALVFVFPTGFKREVGLILCSGICPLNSQ